MKLLMTLLVRNEEDILDENIRYHISKGVDYFIISDNKSTDNTKEIVLNYVRKGVAEYCYQNADDYNQHEWVTQMARRAFSEYGADWVINNDADEFWWTDKVSIKEVLAQVSANTGMISVPRKNFVPLRNRDSFFYEDMIYKERVSINTLGNPLPPKIAHRGSSSVIVHQGNHRIEGVDGSSEIVEDLVIFHYPLRTYNQFLAKIINGGAAYQRNKSLKKSIGLTWRTLYATYQETGDLRAFYENVVYDDMDIEKGLSSGEIIRDVRLSQYLRLV